MTEKLCPFDHKLEYTMYSDSLYGCDFPSCKRKLDNEAGFRCNICDYDICINCIDFELSKSKEDRMPKYNTYPHTKFCTCWQCRRNDRKNPYTGHNYFCSCNECFNGPNLSDNDTDSENDENEEGEYEYVAAYKRNFSEKQFYENIIKDSKNPISFIEKIKQICRSVSEDEDIIFQTIEDIIDQIEDKVYKNVCTICEIDMGSSNPRQLCGKWRCLNLPYY